VFECTVFINTYNKLDLRLISITFFDDNILVTVDKAQSKAHLATLCVVLREIDFLLQTYCK